MSNRKESLKKSLGITDYPWSSDDEPEPETVQATADQSAERGSNPTRDTSRPSVGDEPGTSGGQPSSTQAAAVRRRRTRMDRDLFWSLLNTPRNTVPLSRSSSRIEVPLSLVARSHSSSDGRANDRPNTAHSNPSSDVQRILAFGRLNRAYRASKSTSNLYNGIQVIRNNGRPSRDSSSIHTNPGLTLAEVSAIVMRRRAQLRAASDADRNVDRLGPTLNQAVLGDPQASSSGVLRPRPRLASTAAPAPGIEPVNIDHSDCDDVDMPSATVSPPPTRNESNEEQEVDVSEVVEVNNVSAVSLEEEIVEIDPEPEVAEVAGGASGGDDQNAPDAEEANENGNLTSEQVQIQTQPQPHGVKRKIDDYEGDGEGEPDSVKEFNQVM
ncbi:uncharacterized protein LOC113236681 [Hyposmocoma kahamanoa]|uniref:uncharacterized protein LOC113236681 n=1 Tax=Hyposmocoma kahamanoa TaxID=1477025 RepID=UPI000E6D7FBC|nr:uncharacterized protein LOC113236681 [Hyposmocoma kahamanoa]